MVSSVRKGSLESPDRPPIGVRHVPAALVKHFRLSSSSGSTAKADNPDWSRYGFIAEEVATADPRLVHWRYQDNDYETVATIDPDTGEAVSTRCLKPDAMLVPDGVQYERLTVLLIDVVRRLRAQVEALEARVVVLEGRDG